METTKLPMAYCGTKNSLWAYDGSKWIKVSGPLTITEAITVFLFKVRSLFGTKTGHQKITD